VSLFAISDLHLPGSTQKPMGIFGTHWEGHFDRIRVNWREQVKQEDIVLLPGDFSWAMNLQDVSTDLAAIEELPGRKILLRGNHDYWWSSLQKLQAILPPSIDVLQNNALCSGRVVICGSRGWLIPNEYWTSSLDWRIYRRELIRLEMSLQAARRLSPKGPLVAMLHYPPFNEVHEPSDVTHLLQNYGVCEAVYGHLHGESLQTAYSGWLDGILYTQVSCDGLGFSLKRLLTEN